MRSTLRTAPARGQVLTVLVVDDEDAIRRVLRRAVAREGIAVHTAESVEAAKRCLREHHVDAAVIDVWLGGESGFDLYAWILQELPALAPRVVFTTGDAVNEAVQRNLSALGRPVLAKPFNLGELVAYLERWKAADSGEGRAPA